MDRIYYIYEIYSHYYSGFADYDNLLIHFDHISFIDATTHVFEIIPASNEFLTIEIESEKYYRYCCENDYPDILFRSDYCGERELKKLAILKSEHPTISEKQWEEAELEYQRYLFKDKYLDANKDNTNRKTGIVHYDMKETDLPYEHSYIEWMD